MMEENEERKEAIKELKYLFYTMPIKPPMECDDKDKWKDNNKKLRAALEYAITSLQEQVPIEDSVSRQDTIYYVKVPENLVVIDFDLGDKDDNKSDGIHLYFS